MPYKDLQGLTKPPEKGLIRTLLPHSQQPRNVLAESPEPADAEPIDSDILLESDEDQGPSDELCRSSASPPHELGVAILASSGQALQGTIRSKTF